MSYSDFVNSLGYGVNLILNGLSTFSNSLIHNYIFITFLGVSLFCSLLYFLGSIFLVFPVKDFDSPTKDKKNVKEQNEPDSTDIVEYPPTEIATEDEL